ncbi:MAG: hypothetical protein SFV15_15610 [Polyangiaceae bacterium]|nr:hypothetical protein [Polyangiaceae bacterium]
MRRISWLLVVSAGWLLGCDEKAAPKPEANLAKAPVAEEVPQPVAKPKEAPELALDDISPRVGYSRVVIKEDRDRANLRAELEPYREFLAGKEVPLTVDRKSSIKLVGLYLDELGELGVTAVRLRTETRKEYPADLRFVPRKRAQAPTACATVAVILEDRGTAVWKVSGGTATKHAHGLGGPDLSTTSASLERFLKGCKQDRRLYVAAPEVIGWGLLFDLAASAQVIPDARPEATTLLLQVPVAGRKVEL